ncbi:WG repeat-containing protein [Caldithrix abyssi]
MDRAGTQAISQTFEACSPFRNGLALVRLNGKVAYIDKTGKLVWSN